MFFAFVPDTGTEDFVCESHGGGADYGPGGGGGRGRAGAGGGGMTA